MRAVNMNRENVVQVLLQHGVSNIDAKNECGVTALHYAAASGELAIVQQLLAHGAAPESRDNRGTTPAMAAMAKGHEHIAALLRQTRR